VLALTFSCISHYASTHFFNPHPEYVVYNATTDYAGDADNIKWVMETPLRYGHEEMVMPTNLFSFL